MDKKEIIILGAGSTGITEAMKLAAKKHDICFLHSVVDSQFTEPKKDEVFTITKLPELPEIWIDPTEPIFNHHKHRQTCAKNRKKRKKKSR